MTATDPGQTPDSGSGGGSASGPTVLRMLLGGQLRRLRDEKGISRDDAGYAIRASESKISRMELGRVSFKERDVADLLTLYGVIDQPERESLLALARRANEAGWWQRYGDAHPKWFEPYLGLEADASLIRTYEVQFVPGLLQTADYAREVIRLGHRGAEPADLERRVTLRMERQAKLHRHGRPRLWAVIDEAALRRPIGGAAVMRRQLEALIEMSTHPYITVQVVSFTTGGHAAAGGAFTLLRFDAPDVPDIVYMEQLTSGLYVDQRRDVDSYVEVMERLCVEAESPERTVKLLTQMCHELD